MTTSRNLMISFLWCRFLLWRRCRQWGNNKQIKNRLQRRRPCSRRGRPEPGTLRSAPAIQRAGLGSTEWLGRDTLQADQAQGLPGQDHTLPMTEATGAIANAGPGQADIGVPTNVVLDGAVIGGLPTDTGTSTIIRRTGRRRSFQISNMPIPPRPTLRRHRTQYPYPYQHRRRW
jgi:hypothetical protein